MAVEKAGSFEPDKVLQAVVGLEIEAPEGHLKVHENRHLYKFNRIGRLNAQGMFDILNKSGTLTPNPFLIQLNRSGYPFQSKTAFSSSRALHPLYVTTM